MHTYIHIHMYIYYTFPSKGIGGFVHLCIDILEIHACNNPSPVLKRCTLSAVASTSSQGGGGGGGGGVVRLDRGGGWWLPKCFQMYKNISGHIIIFPKIQLFSNSLSHVLRIT